jgi:hypothetical protein
MPGSAIDVRRAETRKIRLMKSRHSEYRQITGEEYETRQDTRNHGCGGESIPRIVRGRSPRQVQLARSRLLPFGEDPLPEPTTLAEKWRGEFHSKV